MDKLEAMLKYASEHNDFYKKRIAEYGIMNPLDITQWPVLTRKELQENRYNMFSDGYKGKYLQQQLRRQFSSGSTGVPVNVYWDFKDWYSSMMSLWRKRKNYYGITTFKRVVKFTYQAKNTSKCKQEVITLRESENSLVINRACLINEEMFLRLFDIIDEFSPDWLYLQPYILKQLLYYYKKNNRKPRKSLQLIESVGEILSSSLKEKTALYFEAPVANMYGSEEMNGIAYECPYHNMHVLEDNVLVERNNTKSNVDMDRRAIITNLNNKAMPLIRYDQGDSIIVEKQVGVCQCGDYHDIICEIGGRIHEGVDRNGLHINTYLLVEIIDETNNLLKDIITKYKFVYYINGDVMKCYLKLEANKLNWRKTVEKSITMSFVERGIINLPIQFIYDLNNHEIKAKENVFIVQEKL